MAFKKKNKLEVEVIPEVEVPEPNEVIEPFMVEVPVEAPPETPVTIATVSEVLEGTVVGIIGDIGFVEVHLRVSDKGAPDFDLKDVYILKKK